MTDTTSRIRAFIVENFLFGDEGGLVDDQASLIDADLVNSTGILELVSFLEADFGLSIADPEIVPENLESVARLAAFVERKVAAKAAAHA
jgi:acyl carrier protein